MRLQWEHVGLPWASSQSPIPVQGCSWAFPHGSSVPGQVSAPRGCLSSSLLPAGSKSIFPPVPADPRAQPRHLSGPSTSQPSPDWKRAWGGAAGTRLWPADALHGVCLLTPEPRQLRTLVPYETEETGSPGGQDLQPKLGLGPFKPGAKVPLLVPGAWGWCPGPGNPCSSGHNPGAGLMPTGLASACFLLSPRCRQQASQLLWLPQEGRMYAASCTLNAAPGSQTSPGPQHRVPGPRPNPAGGLAPA